MSAQNKQITYHRAGNYFVGDAAQTKAGKGGPTHSALAKNGAATIKDFQMSQSQKLSMKSARDRPSSNLGFTLQTSEAKPPRDRSQQAVGHYQQAAAGGHG